MVIKDIKPNNRLVDNIKPNNSLADDIRPNNKLVNHPTTVYRETRVVHAGEIQLLVPLITYPVAETFANATRI